MRWFIDIVSSVTYNTGILVTLSLTSRNVIGIGDMSGWRHIWSLKQTNELFIPSLWNRHLIACVGIIGRSVDWLRRSANFNLSCIHWEFVLVKIGVPMFFIAKFYCMYSPIAECAHSRSILSLWNPPLCLKSDFCAVFTRMDLQQV